MTSAPVRDPLGGQLLTQETAALLDRKSVV